MFIFVVCFLHFCAACNAFVIVYEKQILYLYIIANTKCFYIFNDSKKKTKRSSSIDTKSFIRLVDSTVTQTETHIQWHGSNMLTSFARYADIRQWEIIYDYSYVRIDIEILVNWMMKMWCRRIMIVFGVLFFFRRFFFWHTFMVEICKIGLCRLSNAFASISQYLNTIMWINTYQMYLCTQSFLKTPSHLWQWNWIVQTKCDKTTSQTNMTSNNN